MSELLKEIEVALRLSVLAEVGCVLKWKDSECLLDNLYELHQRITELETSTYCAYCGEKYPLDDKAASAVSEHIKTCNKHPMRKLEDEWDAKATSYRVERDKANAENVALQARIDELEDALHNQITENESNQAEAIAEFVERIATLEAQLRWIPVVGHRLPAAGDEIIVLDKWGVIYSLKYESISYFIHHEITHWKQRPNPPEEKA